MAVEVKEPVFKKVPVKSSVTEKFIENGPCYYREVPEAIFMNVNG